ncbi:hypothetical protein I4U23_015945 [Adineta vaga]|nr:hypothetical protein I4U23_015945 [Adineta vaga]
MLLFQRFILLICCCFLTCNALHCITNCSHTFSFDTPFNVPSQCNQMVSANKCRLDIIFWYYLQEYVVAFKAEPSNTIISADNQHNIVINILPTTSYYFKYAIHYACTERSDCVQDFARITITEMLARQINYLSVVSELRPLVSVDPQSPNNSNLICFDSKENLHQCANRTNPGSCFISDKLTENEIIRYCDNGPQAKLGYLNISDSGSHATFDVHCNRSLCNEHSTLKAVKDILFKYRLTKTPDGRLNNDSQFIKLSVWLIVILLTVCQ